MKCELQISKYCSGRSRVYSGLSRANCCKRCANLFVKRYWKKHGKKVKR